MRNRAANIQFPVKKTKTKFLAFGKMQTVNCLFRGETARKRGNFSAFRNVFLPCFSAKNHHCNLGIG